MYHVSLGTVIDVGLTRKLCFAWLVRSTIRDLDEASTHTNCFVLVPFIVPPQRLKEATQEVSERRC